MRIIGTIQACYQAICDIAILEVVCTRYISFCVDAKAYGWSWTMVVCRLRHSARRFQKESGNREVWDLYRARLEHGVIYTYFISGVNPSRVTPFFLVIDRSH